jgi:hypothetical protein
MKTHHFKAFPVLLSAGLVLLAISPRLNAAIMLPGSGSASSSASYTFDTIGVPYQNILGVNPLNATIDTGEGSIITMKSGGGFIVSDFAAAATFDLDTKISIEGDVPELNGVGTPHGSVFAGMNGFVSVAFVLQVGPLDFASFIPGHGFAVLTTQFSWGVVGEVAPGDRVNVSLFNVVGDGSLHIFSDSAGNPLAYSKSFEVANTGTETLPFSFTHFFSSQRWHGGQGGLVTAGAGYEFSIEHVAGSSGRSWVGFSDPGTINEIAFPASAVPEPASLAIWSLAALSCALGIRRRRDAIRS